MHERILPATPIADARRLRCTGSPLRCGSNGTLQRLCIQEALLAFVHADACSPDGLLAGCRDCRPGQYDCESPAGGAARPERALDQSRPGADAGLEVAASGRRLRRLAVGDGREEHARAHPNQSVRSRPQLGCFQRECGFPGGGPRLSLLVGVAAQGRLLPAHRGPERPGGGGRRDRDRGPAA